MEAKISRITRLFVYFVTSENNNDDDAVSLSSSFCLRARAHLEQIIASIIGNTINDAQVCLLSKQQLQQQQQLNQNDDDLDQDCRFVFEAVFPVSTTTVGKLI